MKFLALFSAALFCLPAGWCCLAGTSAECCTQVEGPQADAPTRCPHCLADEGTRQDDTNLPPSGPSKPCCCEAHPVVPAKGVEPVAVDALPAFVAFDPELRDVSVAAPPEARLPADEGPPLYVLKCVWRC